MNNQKKNNEEIKTKIYLLQKIEKVIFMKWQKH